MQKGLKGQNFDVEKRVEQAVEEKLEEIRGACRILGFDDIRDIGFEDDGILLTQGKIDAIADMICQVKPDLLIAHHPYESRGLKCTALSARQWCTLGKSPLVLDVATGAAIVCLHLLHESHGLRGEQQS